jgi:hypothetical protein
MPYLQIIESRTEAPLPPHPVTLLKQCLPQKDPIGWDRALSAEAPSMVNFIFTVCAALRTKYSFQPSSEEKAIEARERMYPFECAGDIQSLHGVQLWTRVARTTPTSVRTYEVDVVLFLLRSTGGPHPYTLLIPEIVTDDLVAHNAEICLV